MSGAKTEPGLHLAAMLREPEQVAALLLDGADPNAPDATQFSPLHYAAASGVMASVRLLLDAGAQVNARSAQGDHALHVMLRTDAPSLDIARLLLHAGIEVDAEGKLGDTALTLAIQHAHRPFVTMLLTHGASINKPGRARKPPIVHALEGRRYDMVQRLLEQGANPNTPELMTHAVKADAQGVVAWLLKHNQGRGAAHGLAIAAAAGNTAMMRLILAHCTEEGALASALCQAVERSQTEAVQLLLKHGANVNGRTYAADTALMRASVRGSTPCVMTLLAAGADITARNTAGYSALMHAVKAGHPAVVDHLIHAGAPLDAFDRTWGYTALTIARLQTGAHAQEVLALLEHAGAAERPIHRPPAGERLPYEDCEVCVYLPTEERALEQTPTPLRDIPPLQTLHTRTVHEDPDNDVTVRLLQCPVCGTRYEYRHEHDREDAWISPPHIVHTITRCTP